VKQRPREKDPDAKNGRRFQRRRISSGRIEVPATRAEGGDHASVQPPHDRPLPPFWRRPAVLPKPIRSEGLNAGEDVLREMRKGASGVGRIVYGKEFVGKLIKVTLKFNPTKLH